ncbi:MAG: DivIVA domain-containing protein [Acidimicrobiales bacterium]
MTVPFDFFADEPSPTEGTADGLSAVAKAHPPTPVPQQAPEPQTQLAPRGEAHKAVAPSGRFLEEGEAEHMTQLSGHDIRMKDFSRALLRGYSRREVDDFLTDLIASLDVTEREPARSEQSGPPEPTPTPTPTPEPTPSAPEQGIQVLRHAQRTADAMVEQAHVAAHAMSAEARENAAHVVEAANREAGDVRETARQQADEIRLEGREAGHVELEAARAHAARGLQRARDRAEQILQAAGEREQQAARIEAEAELRLAHVEQRLAEKAKAVTDQARRLDALAAWLVGTDIRREDPSAHGVVAAHAAPITADPDADVLSFRRTEAHTSA